MAIDYNLKVMFSDEQLQTIYTTGSNVIIAKPTGQSGPNVAWQVFKPMSNNTIQWEEKYGIYVSNSALVHGAELYQQSSTPIGAQSDTLYTLGSNAVISNPATGGQKDSFSLLNNYDSQDYMTVGLYQGAVVNGTPIEKNALSAAPVMLKSTALMTPYTTVYVWIQSQVLSNTVVTTVTSPMTELIFGGGVDTLSVAYDSKTGTFLPA